LLDNLARHDPTTLRLTDIGHGPSKGGDDNPHAHVGEAGEPHLIANVTRLRPDELATGARLAALFPERSFRESEHVGAEFVDDLGRSYDVVGGGPQSSLYFTAEEFTDSIR